MENVFYTLIDYIIYSEGITYLLMGAILVFLLLFWLFLTGRDDKKRTF